MKLSFWQIFPIGMMLFSAFFGAGNLIFPPILGQEAGTNAIPAILGFILTGVGMPLLGIISIAKNGHDDPNALANRIHPTFSSCVTILIALTIGPFFAVPRTGAVSFDIGVRTFLAPEQTVMGLAVYSFIFFLLTYVLSINPSKIVAWVGKILSPLLLLTMGILIVFSIVDPMGPAKEPTGTYITQPFFQGFQYGYLTMDLLAAMMFGGMTIDAIRSYGVRDGKEIARLCIYAGAIAAICLGVVYAALAYMGVTSVNMLGISPNGGIALAAMAQYHLGLAGSIILSLIIFFACLTTSIGVTASAANYFARVAKGKVQYDRFVAGICLFSFGVANLGLTNIIKFSVPILVTLYPIVILIVLLPFFDSLFQSKQAVYRCSMALTTIFALLTGLNAADIHFVALESFLNTYLPFYAAGFGWVCPSLLGVLIGCLVGKKKYTEQEVEI